MLFLLFVFNLVISIANAYGTGLSWTESKHAGGFQRLLSWSGAIMASVGFTWCYAIVVTLGGTTLGLLSPDVAKYVFELTYLAIIVPLIGSGIVITVNSWQRFLKNRSLLNGLETGWNTYAMFHNVTSAIDTIPNIFDDIFDVSDSDDAISTIVFVITAFALGLGCVTTYFIVRHVANSKVSNDVR